MKPLVSVIVQTYNHEKFIKQCLDAILMQQTDFPFELILGEDESSDETRQICIDYASKYPDIIKLFLRSRKDVIFIDGNASGRFNMLENLKATSGKYIALCEGDDFWTDALKLQKQVDVLEENPSLVGCFHNSEERYWSDYSRASHLYSTFTKGVEISIRDLTRFNMVPSASVLFKSTLPKELWSNSFKEIPVGDWPLHLLNTRKGNYYYLPQVMSVRNLNPYSTWGMQDQKRNTKKMIYIYTLLIESTWFDKEIVDLLKIGRSKLRNTLIPKKESIFVTYKRKFINNLVSGLERYNKK